MSKKVSQTASPRRETDTVMLSVSAAAKLINVSKTTIYRAIKSGKISAIRQDDGSFLIDPFELVRAYPAILDTAVQDNSNEFKIDWISSLQNSGNWPETWPTHPPPTGRWVPDTSQPWWKRVLRDLNKSGRRDDEG